MPEAAALPRSSPADYASFEELANVAASARSGHALVHVRDRELHPPYHAVEVDVQLWRRGAFKPGDRQADLPPNSCEFATSCEGFNVVCGVAGAMPEQSARDERDRSVCTRRQPAMTHVTPPR